jgi:hypothetical protein
MNTNEVEGTTTLCQQTGRKEPFLSSDAKNDAEGTVPAAVRSQLLNMMASVCTHNMAACQWNGSQSITRNIIHGDFWVYGNL